MNILICGNGKGSWEMRGIQLGAALGARVTSAPTATDAAWCDVAVLVKKHAAGMAPLFHRCGKPIVWDALDFWSQPAQNGVTEAGALDLLKAQIATIRPTLVIGATQAMARAAAQFCRADYLPHHSWAGLVPTPPRETVQTVAYQGNALYLGRWHGWLTDACQKRGWRFVVNPENLSDADIIVAFRDGPWDGWICREWKSGVKVSNAVAAYRPIIMQNCAAARETYGPSKAETREELARWFDEWAPFEYRDDLLPGNPFTLDTVAARYRDILATVGAPCTA